jgi:hypothetical protein
MDRPAHWNGKGRVAGLFSTYLSEPAAVSGNVVVGPASQAAVVGRRS